MGHQRPARRCPFPSARGAPRSAPAPQHPPAGPRPPCLTSAPASPAGSTAGPPRTPRPPPLPSPGPALPPLLCAERWRRLTARPRPGPGLAPASGRAPRRLPGDPPRPRPRPRHRSFAQSRRGAAVTSSLQPTPACSARCSARRKSGGDWLPRGRGYRRKDSLGWLRRAEGAGRGGRRRGAGSMATLWARRCRSL